jgi:hypothetical protein
LSNDDGDIIKEENSRMPRVPSVGEAASSAHEKPSATTTQRDGGSYPQDNDDVPNVPPILQSVRREEEQVDSSSKNNIGKTEEDDIESKIERANERLRKASLILRKRHR